MLKKFLTELINVLKFNIITFIGHINLENYSNKLIMRLRMSMMKIHGNDSKV